MASWPDSTNTGVPDGVKLLPSGDIIVTKPGTVISGLNITGTVYIDADNVTLQNCKITAASFAVVYIKAGSDGVVVKDCEINGVGTNNSGSHGIYGGGTFLRNEIYNVENGISLSGTRGTVIEGNYIHSFKASGSPHYDGIQMDGGQTDTIIRGNSIILNHGQTAAVMIDNYFGPIKNVLVTDNLLVGGGYTVYSDGQFSGGSMSGIEITNNHIGGGRWGDLNINNSSPVYTGNSKDGAAIAATLNGNGNETGSGQDNDTDNGTTTPPPVTEPTNPTTPTQPGNETGFTGTNNADRLVGNSSANFLDGKGGNDILDGAGGNDTLYGGAGRDTMTGGAGNDVFLFKSVSEMGRYASTRDIITDFVSGQDKIDLSSVDANASLSGVQDFTFLARDNQVFSKTAGELAWHTDAANNRTIIQGDTNGDGRHDFEIELKGLVSLKASDFVGLTSSNNVEAPTTPTTPPTPPTAPTQTTISGTRSADRLTGDAGANFLDGNAGNDTLNGGAGNDTLSGGTGRDTMTGGAGNDIFLFKSAAETGRFASTRDIITDFTKGEDKIDLSEIDANTKSSGNQAFTFLAKDDQIFGKNAGELAFHTDDANNRTLIQADTNGDGVHDFEIQLTGLVQLSAGDFIL
ncbi:MAG: M10 family metallopeptidase C-terminal domain-containing protein [Devosia sp.]|uniref:M10 family metallopeptidase C-terminal domain-containing protein n=1 Tax=Devosia sp. TaxID=1871048 RepID=UPI0019EFD931|nr:M10 family metallopeptidase C-terminal domain-containing protein [Devosia sp.]MBF0677798.1 M10 family metallopeptidase C-terminal domain-containing protein [Devosia sp.]